MTAELECLNNNYVTTPYVVFTIDFNKCRNDRQAKYTFSIIFINKYEYVCILFT